MNESFSLSVELRRYIALVWHWAWLLVLLTGLAGGAAYLNAKRMTPLYRASTLVLVNEAPANRSVDYSSMVTSQYLAQTYAKMMTTLPIMEAVAERIGLDKSYGAALKGEILVQQIENTQLMNIYVTNPDPNQAALIANTLVKVFSEQNQADQASRYAASKQSLENQMAQANNQIQEINNQISELADLPANQSARDQLNATLSQYNQTYAYLLQSYEQIRLAEAQSTSNIIQKEPARTPTSPIQPRVFNSTFQGAVVGFVLAAGLIFLIEALDDTLKDPQEITRRFGLPILGLIATHGSEEEKLITQAQPRSPVAEAFRSLRTNLQYASVDHPLHTILVTSPSPEDGKSTIAANLSIVLAQSGRTVGLIDADLRRPVQHRLIGLINRGGLSGLFADPNLILDGNLQKTGTEYLYAIPAGRTPPNPSELLGSDKMYRILESVRQRTDVVVIDTPPVLAVTDAVVLSPKVDGVLLVVKPGVTKLPMLKQSIDQLRQVGANILGIVLNDVQVQRSGYKYYYYRAYQHAYQNRYIDNTEEQLKNKRN